MREWQRNSVIAQAGGMIAAPRHPDFQPTVGKLGRSQRGGERGHIGVRRLKPGGVGPNGATVFILRTIIPAVAVALYGKKRDLDMTARVCATMDAVWPASIRRADHDILGASRPARRMGFWADRRQHAPARAYPKAG
jgi:hypothetical protein